MKIRRLGCFFIFAGMISMLLFVGVQPSSAQSTYLDRFAPPANPDALPPFTKIRVKPVGRVDARVEAEVRLLVNNTTAFGRVVLDGYAIIEPEGANIRRTDKLDRVSFTFDIPSQNSKSSGTAHYDSVTYMKAVLSPRNEFLSLDLDMEATARSKSLKTTGPLKKSEAAEALVGIASLAINASSNTIVTLPDQPVAVGDLLLNLDADEYRRQLAILLSGSSVKDKSGQNMTEDARKKFLNMLEITKINFGLRLKGVTRFRNVDLLDYRGPIALYFRIGDNEGGGEGEARALIDPATGLVRAYIFDGITVLDPDSGPTLESKIQYIQETVVEQKISAPLPQNPAKPIAFKPADSSESADTSPLPPLQESTSLLSASDIYDRSIGSVVVVRVPSGHGSGFFIADDIVVTNAHVVGKFKDVDIVARGKNLPGKVVKLDETADIAFVRTAKGPRPLLLANDIPRTGELALAIGAPLDEGLAGTLTGGLVSSIRVIQGYKWIQTDVSISSGNSGGPILDAKGRVIGMTTFSLKPKAEFGHAEGLNFAISAVEIRKFYGQ